MRIIALFILVVSSATVTGQRIDYRNDSLLINNYYVTVNTAKSTLDSLLKTKGKQKKGKGKYKPGTKEPVNWVKYSYPSRGITFTKHDIDTTKLLIAIKLHKHSDQYIDNSHMPTRLFKGELFVGENYMNDKREVEQFEQLKDCIFVFDEKTGQGYITYHEKYITVRFDYSLRLATIFFLNSSLYY